MAASTTEEELRILDTKLKTLKLDYEQYFLGARPRPPAHLRSEVQKMVTVFLNTPIPNTAMRFRFNSLNSRFQTFKRQWDDTLRKIENGTYERHVFKARLHEKSSPAPRAPGGASSNGGPSLFDSYKEAAAACGQDVSSLTPDKLRRVVEKQESAIRSKLGCDGVDFRVIVQDGKVKLKASPRR